MTAPTDREREYAARAGRFAAARGLPVTVCPYPPNGGPRDRVLLLAFARGYLTRVPAGLVDYDT